MILARSCFSFNNVGWGRRRRRRREKKRLVFSCSLIRLKDESEKRKIIDTSLMLFVASGLMKNAGEEKKEEQNYRDDRTVGMKIRIWLDVHLDLAERMFNSHSFSLYGGHQDEVNCLVFSRDLEILLTGSIDGHIRLWNTVFEHLTLKINEKTGKCHAGLTSTMVSPVFSIQVVSAPWQSRITIDTLPRLPTIPMFVCTKHAPAVCCIDWKVQTSVTCLSIRWSCV